MLISEIRDNIAQHFGKSLDIPFKSRVQSEIISARGEVIKQHFQKYGTYPESLVAQINSTPTLSVDIAENNNISLGENVKKTVEIIPTPIRMSNRNSNFIYVGAIDGKTSFSYIQPETYEDIKHDRFSKNSIYYTYINNHIYIYGTCPKNIRIRLIAADPYEVAVLNGESEENCPQYLEIPEDFVQLIERMIIELISRSFVKPEPEEEIKIEEDND